MVILACQDNVTLVELEMGNLSEEETCFERLEDAEYINHCIYYIEVSVSNCMCEEANQIFVNIGTPPHY